MRIVICSVFICLFFAISVSVQSAPNHIQLDRSRIITTFYKNGVLNSDRRLVHFSHTCDLTISGEMFSVFDVNELIKGANVPRGYNQIIVLNAKLETVKKIEYSRERPLYCKENQLFVFGNIMIDGLLPEGNVLTFSDNGKQVKISNIDPNDLPGIKKQ